jgi:hypothetical protein
MSTIKITNLTSSGAIVGNVILPVVGNVAGTLTTLKATVDQLKTFITAGAEANITLANTIQSAANLYLYQQHCPLPTLALDDWNIEKAIETRFMARKSIPFHSKVIYLTLKSLRLI